MHVRCSSSKHQSDPQRCCSNQNQKSFSLECLPAPTIPSRRGNNEAIVDQLCKMTNTMFTRMRQICNGRCDNFQKLDCIFSCACDMCTLIPRADDCLGDLRHQLTQHRLRQLLAAAISRIPTAPLTTFFNSIQQHLDIHFDASENGPGIFVDLASYGIKGGCQDRHNLVRPHLTRSSKIKTYTILSRWGVVE